MVFHFIMHNYGFKSRYPFTHPSQDWRSTVCTVLPPNQIECQPECQTMRDGSSSCQYLERHFHRCVLTEQRLSVFSITALTVPGEHKCASTFPLHQWDERKKTEKEILGRKRWRVKRNDIEKGWCREERRGEERGSHGERSCQSLGDFKRTAALWSACSLALCWQLPDCAA